MHRPGWSRVRWIGAVAIATAALTPIAVLAAAAAPAAPARTVSAASAPTCSTAGLVVWMHTNGSGVAGGVYYHLEFTNLSGHSCSLRGYPGVSAVNLAGHQQGSAASRNSVYPPTTVTLANDHSASAVLKITDVGVFSRSACDPTTAAGLRVYPPNRTAAKLVPFPFDACAHAGPVYLSVEVVR